MEFFLTFFKHPATIKSTCSISGLNVCLKFQLLCKCSGAIKFHIQSACLRISIKPSDKHKCNSFLIDVRYHWILSVFSNFCKCLSFYHWNIWNRLRVIFKYLIHVWNWSLVFLFSCLKHWGIILSLMDMTLIT